MSDRDWFFIVISMLILLLMLIFGPDVHAQSQRFATDRDCKQEVNNYVAGARSFLHGAPNKFKSVSKEIVQAHVMEHAPMPSDAMYIMDMDVWGKQDPEQLELVKEQMLKGWNDGPKYTDNTDWYTVAKHHYEACMSRVGT